MQRMDVISMIVLESYPQTTTHSVMKISTSKLVAASPREEWDFSALNLDELEYAKHWEYGREREIWKEQTKEFRHTFYKVAKEQANVLTGGDFDDYFFPFLGIDNREYSSTCLIWYVFEGCIKLPDVMLDISLFSPEWPDTPFELIPEEERKRRRLLLSKNDFWTINKSQTFTNKDFDRNDLFPFPLDLLNVEYKSDLTDGSIIDDNGKIQVTAFLFDWSNSDSELKKLFENWLKKKSSQ